MQAVFQSSAMLASGFVQLIVQGTLILILFNRKTDWKKLLIFALINSFANLAVMYLLPRLSAFVYIIVYFIIMIASLIFLFRFKIIHGLVATFTMYLLASVTHYITMGILKIYLNNRFDPAIWVQSFTNNVIIRNLGTVICIIFVLLIKYFKIRINIPEDINKETAVLIIINLLIVTIPVVPNILFFETTVIEIPMRLIIFNAVSVLFLLSLSAYNTVKFSELEMKKQEIEFQKLYIQTLNDLIDNLRGFKHDFNNIVQVIGGYLSLNDINGLKKYYSQMNSEIRTVNNAISLNLYIKNNPAIYGLLLSKISYSEIKDITFNINIICDINVNIKTFDLCKVLGILLDNALEAAGECEKRFVELYIGEIPDKKALRINISNSYREGIDTDKIYDSGFTTKEGHSGFGLWEVKKIFSKYKNISLDTNASGNIFTQNIIVY